MSFRRSGQLRPGLRYTPSTAGNSMTGSERPSPEPLLKKKRHPQPYWGGDNSGNALEPANALIYRAWGIPAVLPRGIPGNALRALPLSFRNFSRISSGKSQPYTGVWPKVFTQLPATSGARISAVSRQAAGKVNLVAGEVGPRLASFL